MKYILLIILGFLWSARLTAIKLASISGNELNVIIVLSIIGTAILFLLHALMTTQWPPFTRLTLKFYLISGLFGFILPFLFENITAPNLPVFVLVVIISTMPILTLFLNILTGNEKANSRQFLAIGTGFIVALIIILDTSQDHDQSVSSWYWAAIAFLIPALYAINTVFIASKWPDNANAANVAFAQSLIITLASIPYIFISGMLERIPDNFEMASPIAAIALFEALALFVYLAIAKKYGATFVSLANYISMVFAAIIGAILFDDQLTVLTILATLLLIFSLSISRSKLDAN